VFAQAILAASPQKIYSLETRQVQTVPPTFAPPFTIVATIRNLSPNGNSSINSFTLSAQGLRIDSVDQPASGNATVSPDGSTVAVQNISPLKPGDSEFQLTLRVTSCGDGAWSAVTWTGSNLSGNNFTPIGNPAPTTPIACGVLACEDEVLVTSTITDPTLIVTGQRGKYDKNGATCQAVPYYVTNTIPVDKKVHFRWPTSGAGSDPGATFFYTVTASSPPQPGFPKVAWLTDGTGNPIFVTAPPCMSGSLPTPYGSLAADISKTDTRFAITVTGTLPPGEFDIVIGSERMHVTKVTGNNSLFVTRHTGGTTSATHSAGDPVMSTPLPIMTATSGPYKAGDQAQMCLAGQSGNSSTVIDIFDGWVNVNP